MRIALSTPTGYLTAELGGEPQPARGLVTANRPSIGAWETWTVETQEDGTIALKSCNGFYLCAEGGGGGAVHANRAHVGAWEKFRAPGGPIKDAWALTFQTADGQHSLSVSEIGEHVVDAVGKPTYFTVEVIDGDTNQPIPPSQGVARLHLDGNGLFWPNGERQFLKGSDAFCAFEVFLRYGKSALVPMYEELRRYRVNCLRVWSMSVNLQQNEFGRPPFDPRTFPDYYKALPDYLALGAEYGFWHYLGIFPDVQLISADVGWQQSHWDRVWDIVKDRDDLFAVEFQNEAAAHDFNRVSHGFQTRNPNRPWVGTSYSDADPAYASGTFPADDLGGGPMGDIHPSRRYPAQVLDSTAVNNVYYLHNKALVCGEGDRFGWQGNTNRREAELAASATRAGMAATFFHNRRGMRCEVFDDQTRNSADGYFSAFDAI